MKKVIFRIASLLSVIVIFSHSLTAQETNHCSGPKVIFVSDSFVPPQSQELQTRVSNFIRPIYDRTVSQEARTVIQRAIDEWNFIIDGTGLSPSAYTIPISFGQTASSNILATTTTRVYTSSGKLASASMVISNNQSFFIDPTPDNDSEFTNGNLPSGYDLLSVVRHELGHAIGFTGISSLLTKYIEGNNFDKNSLNVELTAEHNHTSDIEHQGDIMNPTFDIGERRAISLYPTFAVLSKAYLYTSNQVHYVSPNGVDVFFTGQVLQPWRTFKHAFATVPAGTTLVALPGTYDETVSIQRRLPLKIMKVRGNNTVTVK